MLCDPPRGAIRLAEAIKDARISAKLSQQELANRLEVSAGAVGQWEIGQTRPAPENLTALSVVLNLTPSELLRLAGARQGVESTVLQVMPGLPTNRTEVGSVELDRSLLDQAQTLRIDIPNALDTHLRQLVGKARAEQWLKENRRALADANAFLARHGLWSDGKRQF